MKAAQPRLSARALIVMDGKLLLVNATSDRGDGKWCVPGGGVDAGYDLRENLRREIHEETGLQADIGDIIAVSEYFNKDGSFHQVDLFFRATVTQSEFPKNWQDTTGVVVHRSFFDLQEMQNKIVLPTFLKDGFWLRSDPDVVIYRGAEPKI